MAGTAARFPVRRVFCVGRNCAAHVAILSRSVALAAGDLVMTGTPAGLAGVVAGDTITGGADGVADVEVTIRAAG